VWSKRVEKSTYAMPLADSAIHASAPTGNLPVLYLKKGQKYWRQYTSKVLLPIRYWRL
jgi:hypothetical protein